jgi:hypothetical protein
MKTIGIVGSRRRDSEADYEATLQIFLDHYEPGDELVSGGCPKGGDRFAEVIAKKCQVPIKIYYAQWNKLGRGAGFARNTNIAEDADVLIAVVASDRKGGTEDTVKKAKKMGKEIVLVPLPDTVPADEIDLNPDSLAV